MSEKDLIVNRVAKSPLVILDLEELYPAGERILIDIKALLYEGLILKEKDFREHIKNVDWSMYRDKNVAIWCSADAIIPTWAYMLLATRLAPYANMVIFGTLDDLEKALFQKAIAAIDLKRFMDKKVVVKGCSRIKVPDAAYVEITRLLTPLASSIMYGEPCSTVPLFKRPK